ncbi:hypothetical protein BDZ94DRAFT_1242368 [Collybia nuda]|uniref:Uncharacterized protein n=1 Tax=Collybia nuda TaxID=64659 RepID=A0A9P5XQX4_9AGAR|nr:hypothetical protein BDZ94DRAFT_1242368 [Collybia nuda]
MYYLPGLMESSHPLGSPEQRAETSAKAVALKTDLRYCHTATPEAGMHRYFSHPGFRLGVMNFLWTHPHLASVVPEFYAGLEVPVHLLGYYGACTSSSKQNSYCRTPFMGHSSLVI